ncbi:MAG: hypothetical protein Q7S92_05025 [Candidatus Diapherotrites archaeon]|nr:hypothetical protein [Candidatus Diapherotrites archaeon]
MVLNKFYDRYVMTNNLNYKNNNFYLLKTPFVMLPVELLGAMLRNEEAPYVQSLYYWVKHSTFNNLTKEFLTGSDLNSKKVLDFFETYFSASGFGLLQNVDLDLEHKHAIVVLVNNPLQGRLNFVSQLPLDHFMRGVLAGLFSKSLNSNVDCLETQCSVFNKFNACRFVIKPLNEFDFQNPEVRRQIFIQ